MCAHTTYGLKQIMQIHEKIEINKKVQKFNVKCMLILELHIFLSCLIKKYIKLNKRRFIIK